MKWLTEHNDSEKTPELRLEHLEHAFPYSIAPFSEQLTTLRIICPKVTTINIVTEDFVLPHLVGEFFRFWMHSNSFSLACWLFGLQVSHSESNLSDIKECVYTKYFD